MNSWTNYYILIQFESLSQLVPILFWLYEFKVRQYNEFMNHFIHFNPIRIPVLTGSKL